MLDDALVFLPSGTWLGSVVFSRLSPPYLPQKSSPLHGTFFWRAAVTLILNLADTP